MMVVPHYEKVMHPTWALSFRIEKQVKSMNQSPLYMTWTMVVENEPHSHNEINNLVQVIQRVYVILLPRRSSEIMTRTRPQLSRDSNRSLSILIGNDLLSIRVFLLISSLQLFKLGAYLDIGSGNTICFRLSESTWMLRLSYLIWALRLLRSLTRN